MTMRANYFNLLLVLLMGVLPIQLQASESEKNVILYTPYTKIAVPPGESVNYSIDAVSYTHLHIGNPCIGNILLGELDKFRIFQVFRI